MTRHVAKSGHMTICGTDEYMAPELIFDEVSTIHFSIFILHDSYYYNKAFTPTRAEMNIML